MGKLEMIERDVATLSSVELARFRKWFAEFDAENWDRQIAHDVESGALDALADRALAAHKAGKTSAL